MTNCIIYPVPLYKAKRDKSLIVYRLEVGQEYTVASYAWYIEGERKKILVDTGGSLEYNAKERGRTYEEIQTLESGLRKFGVGFDDIDLVIFTHLHHDHTAQARCFPKARLLVQGDELEFAHHPHPLFALAYPRKFIEGLNFEAITGDAKISEAISVIRTPGHSIGGQSVSIKTKRGTAIISGICSVQENYEPQLVGSKLPVIPPTPHYDLIQVYDSMLRIKEIADILIPNHDGKYLQIHRIP